MNDTRTVGNVARMSGLTVRTLHHYDEIGLLTPSQRGDNGYRLYTDEDLERLRQILVYRELGLGLDDIKSIVDEARDPTESLLAERVRIADRMERLRAIADMIDVCSYCPRIRTPGTIRPSQRVSSRPMRLFEFGPHVVRETMRTGMK